MVPKKKNTGRGRPSKARSKAPGQTSASNPKDTATSPSASASTGGGTTTTTTTQLIPSAPSQPTFLHPSSTSQITTTQPLPSAPPVPIHETHQERTSFTSEGDTATDHADPSTAPSASAGGTSSTPKLLPITDDFMSLFSPALAGALAAVHTLKKKKPTDLVEMVVNLLCLRFDDLESVVQSLQGLAEKKGGEVELKMASEVSENLEVINRALVATLDMLAERKIWDGRGGSCGGSERKGGDPDSGAGEGDGGGGGVSV